MSGNQREFEPIGPTMLKNPLGGGWVYCLPCGRWALGFLPTKVVFIFIFIYLFIK
jgi:hypothetical protein